MHTLYSLNMERKNMSIRFLSLSQNHNQGVILGLSDHLQIHALMYKVSFFLE